MVAVKCESCQAEKLVAFSCKRRGFCPSCGARRMAETVALLVDKVLPRLHMLVLDGVYRRAGEGKLRFVPVPAPG